MTIATSAPHPLIYYVNLPSSIGAAPPPTCHPMPDTPCLFPTTTSHILDPSLFPTSFFPSLSHLSPIHPQSISHLSTNFFPSPSTTGTLPDTLTPNISSLSPTSTSNVIPIKLSLDNYQLWLSLMTSFLISIDLYKYVDGTLVALPREILVSPSRVLTSNPTYLSSLRMNNLVRALLLATISNDVLLEVHDPLNAYGIWSSLRRCFLKNSMAREMELKQRLLTPCLNQTPTADYLRELKAIADQLTFIGRLTVQLISFLMLFEVSHKSMML